MNAARNIVLAVSLSMLAGGAAVAFIVTAGPQRTTVPEPVLQEQLKEREGAAPLEPETDQKVEIALHEQNLKPVPGELRGIYLTRWTASSPARVEEVKSLARGGIINAAVIDVKDFSGNISYDTDVALAEDIGAEADNITNIEAYLQSLKKEGLYTIARITVFQDPLLAEARPEFAIKSESAGKEELWRDYKGLAWLDPASKEVWKYQADLAQDAFERGFDEVNFDYVRFPSDGDLFDASYPVWDETTPLEIIISSFFAFLKGELGNKTTSVDLFGLAAANTWDDMGIGQVLENAFPYFDYVSPMVYPSHFASGFLEFERPDEHPYEIVHFSMKRAQERLTDFKVQHPENTAELRPWLQYFDLNESRIEYTPAVVREQILAARDALGESYNGYLLWNSANFYPQEELTEIVFGPHAEE